MRSWIIMLMVTFVVGGFAQSTKPPKDQALSKGNKEFKAGSLADAEAQYRISKSADVSGSTSAYNLGNAIYKQDKKTEAKFAYVKALEKATTKEEKHKIFHNLGNIFMTEKNYSKAVEAYKNALRNKPTDEETRYNYALAKQFLKDNPQDDDGDEKKDQDEEKEQKEQEKENQNNEPDKKPKDENNEGGNDQPNQDNKQPEGDAPPQQMPAGITKEQLMNLLEAVNNEERKVQEKMNQEKIKGKPQPKEKDW
jgi:tetratricopeptide (TPR) repeat protein